MYLYDYHTHSDNSTDGKDKIKDLCISALEAGMKEIAISDHFEPTNDNKNYPEYDAGKYFYEIASAKETYGSEIKIKTAIELGQPHLFPKQSLDLINNNQFDYVLASAHKMGNDTDFSELNYNEVNLHNNCIRYLEELIALSKWNKFDCLGHLDLVKRYSAYYDTRASLIDYREALEEILKTLISNGKGIEVNTSGLRQASNECMPDFDIVSLYYRLGGEIITLGSDAHAAEDVGKGIHEAIEIIKNAGFKYITIFSERRPEMMAISDNKQTNFISRQTA